MATTRIQAVLFDMGGTLEELYYDDAVRLEAARGLQALLRSRELDPGLSVPELKATILQGMAVYQTWREETEIELPPERIWTEYILPDHGLPRGQLAGAAEELAFFYETHFYARSLRPEVPDTLEALRKEGYHLGVISNITSRRIVPSVLEAYRLTHLLYPVLASTEFGRRKPNAGIFLEAARLLGLPPASCAYVGDTVSRDVIGAHRAGYGLAIQIRSFLTEKADGAESGPVADSAFLPDAVISDLTQVLDLVGAAVEESRAC